ncbi:MAG: LysM peptidoglycan-binding domain-containing protein [Chlamydiota bacterium]
MNRRDIIIVAVLINAGLLVTLFISALKKESGADSDLVISSESIREQGDIGAKPTLRQETGGDRVDRVISHYAALTKVEEKNEKSVTPPLLTPPEKREEIPVFKAPVKVPLRVVTVEKGDVLEKIARSHGVSVDGIMKLNNLSNSCLRIGQELKLPDKKAPKIEPKKEEAGKYYVVKGGDSPWTIAREHHMQVEELLKLNHIDREKAKRLRPGDRLKIK